MKLIFLPAIILAQIGLRASKEASQGAIKSLEFVLSGPGNCLRTAADLPHSASQNMAALWLRAAFHDAGTWNPSNKAPAGLDGSIMHFLDSPENAGIEQSIAPKWVQNIEVNISNADAIAIAAQVAITHCGGPGMPFQAGRLDTTNPTSPNGLIPEGEIKLQDARTHFQRMGWSNEDMVVLVTGSHTLGGVHAKNSPKLTNKTFAPFDDTAGIFDNHVFKFAIEGKCLVPLDCEMAKDPVLRPLYQKYASDEQAFFDQYKISFAKLIAQTSSKLTEPQELEFTKHSNLNDVEQPKVEFGIASSQSKNMYAIEFLQIWGYALLIAVYLC